MNISRHAVERYVERARPGMRIREAAVELRERCKRARLVFDAPDWLVGDRPCKNDPWFLMLDDDTCAVMREATITTVVTREFAERVAVERCRARGWVKAA